MIGLGQIVVLSFGLLLVLGRGGAGATALLAALLTSALFGLELAAPFEMEGDEGPHEFGLEETDGHQAVDAHDLHVEVAGGGVQAIGGSGQGQAVPESENAQRDGEQTRDDEKSVENGKGVLGQRGLLGEME